MSERRPLLVIVTRAYEYPSNEWVKTWGFDENRQKAYVSLKEVVFDNYLENEYDILIINGLSYINQSSSLFTLVWDEVKSFEQSRDIHIRIHLPNLEIRLNDWDQKAKCFLKSHAEEYSLGDNPSENDQYVKLANVVLKIRNSSSTAKDKEYKDAISEVIKKKTIIPNLSLLKHRLIHLFLSLDVDLQKIEEILSSPNDEKKAEEYFQEAFSKKNLSGKLKEAKKLVDEIKGIIDVGNIQESAQEALDQIERLLTNSDIQELSKIREDGKGFNEIKRYLAEVKKGEKKSFHDWLCALDDCLDRLRDVIQPK